MDEYVWEKAMPVTALAEVMQYTNEAVVLRFMETWELPRADADDLFEQMKKWLWLSAVSTGIDGAHGLAISQSTKLLDEMWHTFILFTSDYRSFCDRHFGFYLDHGPTSRADYEAQIASYERDPRAAMGKLEAECARQYELIYDFLGEATLVKWYGEYLDRYTDEYLRQIWRWSFSPYDTRVRASVRLPRASAGGDHG
jgi:hypothetical protein